MYSTSKYLECRVSSRIFRVWFRDVHTRILYDVYSILFRIPRSFRKVYKRRKREGKGVEKGRNRGRKEEKGRKRGRENVKGKGREKMEKRCKGKGKRKKKRRETVKKGNRKKEKGGNG